MATKELIKLETARLQLRGLQLSDIKDLMEYASDVEIAHMGMWQPLNNVQDAHDDIVKAKQAYDEGRSFPWAVEHRREGKMIGRINLYDINREYARVEIGCAFNRDYWGHGFATESVRRVLKFAFEVLRMNRVGAACLPYNTGSIRVLTKCGLKLEGVRRDYIMVGGQYRDVNLYSILRREWEK